MSALDGVGEPLGRALGAAAAPLVWAGARLRGDRLFHARGVVHEAAVEAVAEDGPAAQLATRLAGPAFVRLSSSWWRTHDWPDLLGAAVRFGLERSERARQDLVLVTVRRAWTLPWAVVTTRWNDFLRNDYYAVGRYGAEGLGEVEIRARGEGALAGGTGRTRFARLAEAAATGAAGLRLELRVAGGTWRPVARIHLGPERPDARGVRFDPFRTGAGLAPRGLVHALRWAVYPASRLGAPSPHGGSRS